MPSPISSTSPGSARRSNPRELEQLATGWPTIARDVAVPPVRFVKTIGDAVMLVSPDPVPLLDAMLAAGRRRGSLIGLSQSAGRDGVRGGGQPRRRLVRQPGEPGQPGDRDGPAGHGSRPSRRATAIGDAEGFEWSYAGSRRLKGIKGDTKLYRARRPAS